MASWKPWNPWRRDSTLVFENFLGALDAPGEWFLDRNGDLFYIPLPGEDLTKAEVVAPVLGTLVRMAGDPQGGRYVEHVTFDGLSFEHAQYPLPPQGHGDGQAAFLTAGQGDGQRFGKPADTEAAEQFMGALEALGAAEVRAGFEDGQQVVQDREFAEDRFFLGHVAESEAGPAVHRQLGDVMPAETHGTRVRGDEPGDHVERGGFARAIGS